MDPLTINAITLSFIIPFGQVDTISLKHAYTEITVNHCVDVTETFAGAEYCGDQSITWPNQNPPKSKFSFKNP